MDSKYESSSNNYAYQKITSTATGNGWSFGYLRRINMMLTHIDGSNLTDVEKNHWKAVGYFFHSYWYMELINRFGDIPWIETVLNDESPEAYGPRVARKEVADKVLDRLKWAEENIGDFQSRDGDNTINRDCISCGYFHVFLHYVRERGANIMNLEIMISISRNVFVCPSY